MGADRQPPASQWRLRDRAAGRRRPGPGGLAVLAAGLALATACTSQAAAPAPVAAPAGLAHQPWSFGGGHFGRWIRDPAGLPAFEYTTDEATDPAARWNDGNGTSTSFWHQLGNDRVVADAFNDGYVQLWDGERQAEWANYYDPVIRQYGGGFGYLRAGRATWSTLYADRPAGASFQRVFGMGYYRKQEQAHAVQATQTVFAPFGRDPVLLSQIQLRNTGHAAKTVHYYEYWGVNPQAIPPGIGTPLPNVPEPAGSVTYQARSRTLVARPARGDPAGQSALFLASLTGPVAGYETSAARFFGTGSRARPAEVASGRLSDRPGHGGVHAMFALESTVRLRPGQARTLVYAYGYSGPQAIGALVRSLAPAARTALAATESGWRAAAPRLALPGYPWLSRETAWDYYYLRSSQAYDAAQRAYVVAQGYDYLYYWGENAGVRDALMPALPMAYLDPALARQTVIFGVRAQPRSGELPYGFGDGKPVDLSHGYRADDSDLWLLWAASQYVLATRDFGLLGQREPYLSGGSGTVLAHLELAYAHLLHGVGFGPHGEFRMLGGDWSDGEGRSDAAGQFGGTESTPTTAQAAWVLPYFAQAAAAAGQPALARQARAEGAALRKVVARQWTGRWFNRGYRGTRPYGVAALYINPQPWALLSGAATRGQAAQVAHAIGTLLSAPSPIGAASESRDRYGREKDRARGTGTLGGTWYALNGPDIWALGPVDPALAFREYADSTHAAYAHAYPRNWFGVLSGPDSWNSFESRSAGQPSIPFYPVQDSQSSLWELYDTTAESGITATASGYVIDPHWPSRTFSWDAAGFGVSYQPASARGYLRTAAAARLTMRVRLPARAGPHPVIRTGSGVVRAVVRGGFAEWTMATTPGQRATWSLSG